MESAVFNFCLKVLGTVPSHSVPIIWFILPLCTCTKPLRTSEGISFSPGLFSTPEASAEARRPSLSRRKLSSERRHPPYSFASTSLPSCTVSISVINSDQRLPFVNLDDLTCLLQHGEVRLSDGFVSVNKSECHVVAFFIKTDTDCECLIGLQKNVPLDLLGKVTTQTRACVLAGVLDDVLEPFDIFALGLAFARKDGGHGIQAGHALGKLAVSVEVREGLCLLLVDVE